jgi:hypothetical protein
MGRLLMDILPVRHFPVFAAPLLPDNRCSKSLSVIDSGTGQVMCSSPALSSTFLTVLREHSRLAAILRLLIPLAVKPENISAFGHY